MSPAVPIRRLFRIVNGGTPDPDANNWDGGVPWVTPEDLGAMNGGYVDSTRRTLSKAGIAHSTAVVSFPGALVVSTRAPIGYVAQLRVAAATNQGCRTLVPRTHADSRFFRYALMAQRPTLQARGQGSTFRELSTSDLASIEVVAPTLGVQTSIADYLERETSRIDALIQAKKRLLGLVEARWQAELEAEIRALAQRHAVMPLKYAAAQITVGIVVTPSAWYADTGVPAIRGTNVEPGRISTDDLVYLTPEGDALHVKSRLLKGDVVVVRTGQAGAAAVVPAELVGANCIDLVIIRPGARLNPAYLELVMNSDWLQKHVDEFTVGTIQGHFNVGAAKNVPIPLPELCVQTASVGELRKRRSQRDKLDAVIRRQIDLLDEERQALITAAVNGQIDVWSAA